MKHIKPKKRWGQHFLKDQNIAQKIVNQLQFKENDAHLLEIGPGTGVLTDLLLEKHGKLTVVEIDEEAIDFLKKRYDSTTPIHIIQGDFLEMDLHTLLQGNWSIIGNFPYNISSQIFFKLLEQKNQIQEIVCMLQREVAQRIASPPGNKDYGILSVLLQAYFTIDYIFTVNENAFHPAPKIKSGVIRLTRNERKELPCDEKLFFRLVKQAFQTRRKMLRNALKPLISRIEAMEDNRLSKRAEQLGVDDFIELTKKAETFLKFLPSVNL